MSDFDDDIARGCLENGECLEAKWGTGWWTRQPEPEQEPYCFFAACPFCGEVAIFFGWDKDNCQFIKCEHCGKKGLNDH